MSHPYTNKLIDESSPYLLQHAHNPVDWYPWGEEALERARKENKLLLISIGYSSCHWCHVMEHESFEDSTVARMMNEHFINIKVDREERPDIDDIYMTACQLSTGGSCGWPLNSFALPDGRPVWAGTYFPKGKWLDVLEYFRKTWSEEAEKMEDYATRLVAGVRDSGLDEVPGAQEMTISVSDVHATVKIFMDRMDPQMGGRRGAPKFPMPNNGQFLMHYAERYQDERARTLVLTTLDRIMMGGIYDQLEGGFARYATDSAWLVPHFEKMLYDNGQLVSLYAQAYAWTGKTDYLNIAEQTIDFVMRYWSDPSGGYYSSFDADSEGEEGRYYVWTKEELDGLIPAGLDRDLFYALNDIRPEGNWEHQKNILQRHRSYPDLAQRFGISEDELRKKISGIHQRLLNVRSTRIAPGLDDKILTSWNALMLQGIIDAWRITGKDEYLKEAKKNAAFIVRELIKPDYRLDRNFKNGRSTINAFLDDYAICIQAFLSLYQITFDTEWLNHAKGLTGHVLLHFDGDPSGFFYYTSDLDPPLVARRIDFGDNVISSGNSIMARNLYLLGELLYQEDYSERAKRMFRTVWPRIEKDSQPSFYSNWCILMLGIVAPPTEVAIVGSQFQTPLAALSKLYLPDVVFLGGAVEGDLPLLKNKLIVSETHIYVCRNKTCKLPTTEAGVALDMIRE